MTSPGLLGLGGILSTHQVPARGRGASPDYSAEWFSSPPLPNDETPLEGTQKRWREEFPVGPSLSKWKLQLFCLRGTR